MLACPALRASAAPVRFRAEPAKSEFFIKLGKAGLFKVFGDDHVIRVNDFQCDVLLDESEMAGSSAKLSIRTSSLKVTDPNLAAEKRAEVQKRMEGPEVLDVIRFPELTFASREVKGVGNERFRVEGDLKIRDVSRPIGFEVTFVRVAGVPHVRGEARIRQTDFGIKPVSVAGGAVKVKDEMKIVFDVVLVPVRP